jgi:lysophospholipase L1-like esterase
MTEFENHERITSVAFFGDSITADGAWEEWFPQYETLNFGVGGDTTDELLARMDQVVEARPDAIALLVGTNDLGMRRSVEHLVRNAELLLVNLRRDLPGARTLVQSIMPRGREFADQIQDANRHLRQFSATVHAQYLDLWPALALEDGEINPAYSDDRLHLNDDGYRAWVGELGPAIERLEDAPPMSRPISVIR